jgi:hypothetical protein
MARRAQREVPGSSNQVAQNVLDAVDHLVEECLNAAGIGAPTEAVAAVAYAIQAMATSNDTAGLNKLAGSARAYLRKLRLPTIAPEPHEVIRGMVRDAERALAKCENSNMTTRVLGMWMPQWGLRAFGVPDAYETAKLADQLTEHYAEWSWAPQDVFRRVEPHVKKALQAGVDAEGLVVAVLVGYGMTRQRARGMVKSAFRNDSRSPKRRRG